MRASLTKIFNLLRNKRVAMYSRLKNTSQFNNRFLFLFEDGIKPYNKLYKREYMSLKEVFKKVERSDVTFHIF